MLIYDENGWHKGTAEEEEKIKAELSQDETAEESMPSDEDRISALEDAMLDIAMMMAEGLNNG